MHRLAVWAGGVASFGCIFPGSIFYAMKSLVGFASALCLVFTPCAAERDGTVPKNDQGRALNLGFEDGTLRDWTASGKAFEGQPLKGDTVAPRRADMKSNHAGEYWVGTYEKKGDEPQGILTSVTFK